MNEQMAIELLNGIIHTSENSDECNNVEIDALHQDALRVAIEAIKEREQHRAIGTVEELQALKEKSVAKPRNLIEGRYYCSRCGIRAEKGYCNECGQLNY